MTELEKAVLATLSYYDIFDYPLTGFEIWRYLIRPVNVKAEEFEVGLPRQSAATVGELFVALDESEFLQEMIAQKHGFYFLRSREELVEKRLQRKKLADMKWKKARHAFRALSLVPFVRGVFVSGSLAMENSKDDSDIDIIVVGKYGRIWTVRTFMTLLTFLMGVRRHGEKTRDRICLNHYITDASLCIPFESLYNAQSYVHMVNVYAEDGDVFRRFQAENGWIKKYVPDYEAATLMSTRILRRNGILLRIARWGELALGGAAGDKLEKLFAAVESNRIRRDPLFAKGGGRITIDDKQLEFHPDSHEYFIIPEFNRRMKAMGLTEFGGQKDSGLNN